MPNPKPVILTQEGDQIFPITDRSLVIGLVPEVETTIPVGGMLPNVLYKLGTLTGSVTISFATPADYTRVNEWKITFTAGSTAPTITWPAAITGWAGNCVEDGAPVITGGNYYEVSVMDGIALIAEVEA